MARLICAVGVLLLVSSVAWCQAPVVGPPPPGGVPAPVVVEPPVPPGGPAVPGVAPATPGMPGAVPAPVVKPKKAKVTAADVLAMPSVPPVMVVADGIVYVAFEGKLTAFNAKTLEKIAEATYWKPPKAPKAMLPGPPPGTGAGGPVPPLPH